MTKKVRCIHRYLEIRNEKKSAEKSKKSTLLGFTRERFMVQDMQGDKCDRDLVSKSFKPGHEWDIYMTSMAINNQAATITIKKQQEGWNTYSDGSFSSMMYESLLVPTISPGT